MDLDPGILCFLHCSHRIFCFQLPTCCPICSQPLSDVFPFRIPYPFVRASQHACTVVIKRTDGNFLESYNDDDDLHIGVTSSSGVLHEYDERGLVKGTPPSDWDQSLIVYKRNSDESTLWDEQLTQTASNDSWSSKNYDEKHFNCYDFVSTFLKSYNQKSGMSSFTSKEMFIEEQVKPIVLNALKYIKLYRNVCSQTYHHQQHN